MFWLKCVQWEKWGRQEAQWHFVPWLTLTIVSRKPRVLWTQFGNPMEWTLLLRAVYLGKNSWSLDSSFFKLTRNLGYCFAVSPPSMRALPESKWAPAPVSREMVEKRSSFWLRWSISGKCFLSGWVWSVFPLGDFWEWSVRDYPPPPLAPEEKDPGGCVSQSEVLPVSSSCVSVVHTVNCSKLILLTSKIGTITWSMVSGGLNQIIFF